MIIEVFGVINTTQDKDNLKITTEISTIHLVHSRADNCSLWFADCLSGGYHFEQLHAQIRFWIFWWIFVTGSSFQNAVCAGSNLLFQFWLATFFKESFHEKLISILISSFFIVCIPVKKKKKKGSFSATLLSVDTSINTDMYLQLLRASTTSSLIVSPIMLANYWHLCSVW